MANAKSTEVAEKKNTSIAAFDYGEDAGAGFENTTSADLSIPFIAVLQSNSPQVEDEVEGAKAGLLFNTVTGEIYSGEEGINFLPVHKEQSYVEWVPRTEGGGFVGLHAPSSDVVKQAIEANGGNRIGKLALENGNELVETHYMYGLILNSDGTESEGFGVIAFTSTKIKPFRDWTTSMYTLKGRPPLFANRAHITTVKQKNEKGTYYNFSISPLKENWKASLINPQELPGLLEEARGFREMVTSGMARAAFESQDAAGSKGEDDEDIPF